MRPTRNRAPWAPGPEEHRSSEHHSFPSYSVHIIVNIVHSQTRARRRARRMPLGPLAPHGVNADGGASFVFCLCPHLRGAIPCPLVGRSPPGCRLAVHAGAPSPGGGGGESGVADLADAVVEVPEGFRDTRAGRVAG